jgi:hypothetical protein
MTILRLPSFSRIWDVASWGAPGLSWAPWVPWASLGSPGPPGPPEPPWAPWAPLGPLGSPGSPWAPLGPCPAPPSRGAHVHRLFYCSKEIIQEGHHPRPVTDD